MPLDNVPLTVGNLPVVLAGPLLRRLTRTKVTVWVALSVGDPVTLELRKAGTAGWNAAGPRTPVRVGRSLWLVAITAPGVEAGEFKASTLYEYRLVATGWPGARSPTWTDFSYAPSSFPSFLGLPTALADFRILHTSCRKPHGGGRDALALAHGILGTTSEPRPNVLILSGDQIYGDDVGAPLVPRIRRLAADLVGIDERSMFSRIPSTSPSDERIHGRKADSKSFGLTSGESEDHLWTFGEFLAAYLLSWGSTALWPTTVPTWSAVSRTTDIAPAPPADPFIDQEAWDEMAGHLEVFKATLPDVRRVLANVSTLMIFDDHEVTDDWNLDFDWVQTLYGNQAGTRVVTNGLLAYLLCQHWGNVPEPFDNPASPEGGVLAAANWNGSGTAPPHPDDTAGVLRARLGVPSAPASTPTELRPNLAAGTSIRYDYTLGPADGYPLRLVVLDERTAREYLQDDRPAGRISQGALDAMLPAPGSGATAVLTLLVAPAPVLGVELIEHYLGPAASLVPGGGEFVDFEFWSPAGPAFQKLLDRIAAYERVVLVSGDVHYGGAKLLAYQKPQGTLKGRAFQMTCSAAKNAEIKTIVMHLYGDLQMRLGLERRREFRGYSTLAQAQRSKLVNPPTATTPPALPYDDLANVLLGRVAREGQESPAVFSADVATAYALPGPDWSYTIEHVDDETLPTDAADLAVLTAAGGVAAWTGWDPQKSYTMVGALRVSDLHRIGMVYLGIPQLARIDFSEAGGKTTARQRLLAAVGENATDTDSMLVLNSFEFP